MNDEPMPTFAGLMKKAEPLLDQLFQTAISEGIDGIVGDLDQMSDNQIRATLALMVLVDRDQQADKPVRFSVDIAALEALATAAESGNRELWEAVLELPAETAAEALGELVALHREIKLTEAVARTSAQFN